MVLTGDEARAWDARDPLGGFRERFVTDGDVVAYLDGNSLGRLPIATRDRLREVVEHEWGTRLIRSWEERWVDLPTEVGDELGAAVLGAPPGQTLIADSTSVNLLKVLHAACGLRPGRTEIVVDATNFPTDRYLVDAVAGQRGLTVRWVRDGLDLVVSDATAVVVLSHVDYRSGALLDLAAITAQVHAAGAVVVWDLCHSVGVVPISLDADDADFAVGCTYKYLNAGPGAPAFLYVAARHLADAHQPIPGWWSAADLFAMADDYVASPTIRRMLSGTPSVLGITAVREGVRITAEAGIDAVRSKSMLLTTAAHELLADAGLDVVSPADGAARGSHVTIRHPQARRVCEAVAARGVLPDFREPDLIRLGLSPLTTSFAEMVTGLQILIDEIGTITP